MEPCPLHNDADHKAALIEFERLWALRDLPFPNLAEAS